MTRIAYTGNGTWIEVGPAKGGQVPIADSYGPVIPQAGDSLICGLSRPGWREALEGMGFRVEVACAMDSRWSSAGIHKLAQADE